MTTYDTSNVSLTPSAESVEARPRFSVRLRFSISTLFLSVIIPVFAILVAYNYRTNLEIYKSNAAKLITARNDQTNDKLVALLDPIGDSLLTLAKQVRDDPRLFEGNGFMDTMLLHLENNPNLVSVFVASDRGSMHQVQSMREGMIVANRVPPAEAKFNFWVVDRSGSSQGVAKATKKNSPATSTENDESANPLATQGGMEKINSSFSFFKTRDVLLDTFVVPNDYEPRERPFYKDLAKSVAAVPVFEMSRYVFVGEVFISASTQRPTMNLSTPVMIGNKFRGMIGESFELSTISNFLKSAQISKNSETYIVDAEGNIVVSTGENSGLKVDKNVLIKQSILAIEGQPAQQAFARYAASKEGRFEFKDPKSSEIYLAQITPFPNTFHKRWVVLTLAPVSDFLVGLKEINKRLIIFGGVACVLLVLLTFVLSLSISRPIEHLTETIRDLLEFRSAKGVVKSNIYEINILSSAVNKLRSTLRAFTSYVPRDLVNDLLKSGQAIQPGGESRYLTIMFTDLKDFSIISEITPSRALLKCVSAYLELVTYAVKEEVGTVDKFIGDGVMAFWGAPLLDHDHAYHSCATAVKSQRRIVDLNRKQVAEGLPALTVRIGIHSDAVLVGNIGSPMRMSYTVMGDGVNIAARLEGINKDYGTSICISHATYKEAGERLLTRPIDFTTVKGRKGEIQIYELLAILGDDPDTMPTEREWSLCSETASAYALYAKQQYAEAAEAYQKIVDGYGDALSVTMKNKCLKNMPV
jgi:adenylate cyclase